MFKHALHEPGDPTTIQVPPPGWRRDRAPATTSPPMPAADGRRPRGRSPLGVAARSSAAGRSRCACGASATGLPFVYNADENAHFVPRRDRDVRAHLQPGLLHQPAGLHLPAARGASARASAGARRSARPSPPTRATSSRSPARCRRVLGDARRRAASRGRARGCSTAASGSSPRRCWPSPSCRCTTATSRSTTCRRSRRSASRWSASPGVCARGRLRDYALAGAGLGLALRDQVHGGHRAAAAAGGGRWSAAGRPRAGAVGGLVLAGVLALACFLIANPYALLDFDAVPRRAARAVRGVDRRRRASSA